MTDHPVVSGPTSRKRWMWLVVLISTTALFVTTRAAWLATDNPNLLPSVVLLGAVIAPATAVSFVFGRRMQVDLSPISILLVASVGGVVGVVSAAVLEFDTVQHLAALPAITVGVIEESTKLIAPTAILLLTRYRGTLNGLMVGVASGAGFAIMETLGYAATQLYRTPHDARSLDRLLFDRGLFSPGTHMAWTGLTVAALFYAASQRWSPASIGWFTAAFGFAVIMHTLWDSSSGRLPYIALATISIAGTVAGACYFDSISAPCGSAHLKLMTTTSADPAPGVTAG